LASNVSLLTHLVVTRGNGEMFVIIALLRNLCLLHDSAIMSKQLS